MHSVVSLVLAVIAAAVAFVVVVLLCLHLIPLLGVPGSDQPRKLRFFFPIGRLRLVLERLRLQGVVLYRLVKRFEHLRSKLGEVDAA